MATLLKSRLLKLWIMILTFCLTWAEVGRLTGIVHRSVLDDLFRGASRWWDQPAAVHILALVFFGLLLFLAGFRFTRGLSVPDNRYERSLAIIVLLLGLFLCLNQFSELNNVVSRRTDFGTILDGSAALFAGADPYAATDNQYFYPPLLAFLFGPLLLAPPAGASTLFFSIKLIMIIWTLLACHRLVGGNHFRAGRHALFVLGMIFVAARFWVADLQYGNTNVVILFLVIASIYFDGKDRPLPAGLTLALAVAIKIVPVVLCLHFLVRGRWRTLAAFVAGLVGFNLLPWVFLQSHWKEAWTAYLDAGVTGKLSERLAQPDNQSLWGTINRIFPAVPLSALRLIWGATSAICAVFVGFVSWRSRNHGELAQVAGASLYPLLGLLVSPGSWVVHYTMVLLPMVVLWKIALSRLAPGRWVWPLFFCTNFAFTISGWSRPTVKASITQSWFVIASLLLMVGIGVWVLGQRQVDSVSRFSAARRAQSSRPEPASGAGSSPD